MTACNVVEAIRITGGVVSLAVPFLALALLVSVHLGSRSLRRRLDEERAEFHGAMMRAIEGAGRNPIRVAPPRADA